MKQVNLVILVLALAGLGQSTVSQASDMDLYGLIATCETKVPDSNLPGPIEMFGNMDDLLKNEKPDGSTSGAALLSLVVTDNTKFIMTGKVTLAPKQIKLVAGSERGEGVTLTISLPDPNAYEAPARMVQTDDTGAALMEAELICRRARS